MVLRQQWVDSRIYIESSESLARTPYSSATKMEAVRLALPREDADDLSRFTARLERLFREIERRRRLELF